jgi:hypothetical protein
MPALPVRPTLLYKYREGRDDAAWHARNSGCGTTNKGTSAEEGAVSARRTYGAKATNAAAWLATGRLPFAATLGWKQVTGQPQIAVMSAPENNLGTCLSGNPAAFGASATWQTGNLTFTSGTTEQTYGAQFFYSGAPGGGAARTGPGCGGQAPGPFGVGVQCLRVQSLRSGGSAGSTQVWPTGPVP